MINRIVYSTIFLVLLLFLPLQSQADQFRTVRNIPAQKMTKVEMALVKGKMPIIDFIKNNGSFIIDPNGVFLWAYSSTNQPITVSVTYNTGTVNGQITHTFGAVAR